MEELTPEGCAVKSDTEHGSVQIYPVSALELPPDGAGMTTTDEIEGRKRQARDAGYTNPMCAPCGNMSTPSSKVCKQCISATSTFTAAAKAFLTTVKGTQQ